MSMLPAPEAIALDGKTLRGSGDTKVHLLAAIVHREGIVIGQTDVDTKTNGITRVEPRLTSMNIEGAVVTGDALLTQREIARHLVEEKKADYCCTVKDKQETLKGDIEALRMEAFPPGAYHGRQGARKARDTQDLDEHGTAGV